MVVLGSTEAARRLSASALSWSLLGSWPVAILSRNCKYDKFHSFCKSIDAAASLTTIDNSRINLWSRSSFTCTILVAMSDPLGIFFSMRSHASFMAFSSLSWIKWMRSLYGNRLATERITLRMASLTSEWCICSLLVTYATTLLTMGASSPKYPQTFEAIL